MPNVCSRIVDARKGEVLMDQTEIGGVECRDGQVVRNRKGRQHRIAAQVDSVLFDHPAVPVSSLGRMEEVPKRRMSRHRAQSTGGGRIHFGLDHSAREKLFEPEKEFQSLAYVMSLNGSDTDFSLVDRDP